MHKTVLIAAGGTGGHIFPALAVAQRLAQHGYRIHWLGTQQGLEKKIIPKHGIPIHYLTVTGLRGKGLKTWVLAPFRLLIALWQAIVIFRKVKPTLMIGMGGFVTGPAGLAAWINRVPLVIHEQNAVAGTTNRILSRFASKVLQAFPDSFAANPRAITTGNPIRGEFTKLALKSPSQLSTNVLILGGSRGALALNQVIPTALANVRKPIEIWHQTGEKSFIETKQQYQQLDLEANVAPFIEDIHNVYQWADLVICRAGALTIAELQAAGLPSILIPFPHAIDDHQTKNAQFLVDQQAAILLPQSELSEQRLAKILNELLADRKRLASMAHAAKTSAFQDATQQVVEQCLPYCS